LLHAFLTLAPQTSLVAPGETPNPVELAGSQAATSAEFVPDVLAACWSTETVVRFDGKTGAFEGDFTKGGPLKFPAGLDFGPDGNLYVTSFYWSTVEKYDGRTGAYLGNFVPANSGGLQQPGIMKFRPNGLLYVLATYNGGVLRFDAQTGAFQDVFIPAGSGGITTAFAMAFGPDGDVYLGGYYSKTVGRFDGTTGAFERLVARSIDTPSGMTFGPSGNLDVGEWKTGTFFQHNVQRYSPSGEFLGKLATLAQGPQDLRYDRKGLLYVSGASSIDVLNGSNGNFIRSMSHPGLQNLMALTFTPRLP
jgi:streptogramin lyase